MLADVEDQEMQQLTAGVADAAEIAAAVSTRRPIHLHAARKSNAALVSLVQIVVVVVVVVVVVMMMMPWYTSVKTSSIARICCKGNQLHELSG
jgi:t-SNARE complex subunit (syntaxin)